MRWCIMSWCVNLGLPRMCSAVRQLFHFMKRRQYLSLECLESNLAKEGGCFQSEETPFSS
jgi:hypothetical protein